MAPRGLGHLVRVAQARLRIVAGQVAEESEEPGIVHRNVRQEGAQLFVVSAGHRADRIECREDDCLLVRVQIVGS